MRRWKDPECNNGIRDQGIKQKLQGSKWIKDLGSRLLLYLRNKRTCSWPYRKTTDSMKIVRQKAWSYATLRKIRNWTLWRGWPPKRKKDYR
jgi:hypothetical protein